MCPAKKDCFNIRNKDGSKEKVQKTLLFGHYFSNICQFQGRISKFEIGFSTFVLQQKKKQKKNFMVPFSWMGFNCLKATATSRRLFTLYHKVPRNFWYSLYRPRKNERLSQPWSHPVVLNTGLLDWKSSALTTRPLLTSLSELYFKFRVFILLVQS